MVHGTNRSAADRRFRGIVQVRSLTSQRHLFRQTRHAWTTTSHWTADAAGATCRPWQILSQPEERLRLGINVWSLLKMSSTGSVPRCEHCGPEGIVALQETFRTTPWLSYRKAVVWALIATYTPFLVAAGYAQAFVTCQHCKTTAWQVLLYAPGLVPTIISAELLHIHFHSSWILAASAGGITAASIWGLTAMLRRSRRAGIGGLFLGCALLSVGAVMTLMVIRA